MLIIEEVFEVFFELGFRKVSLCMYPELKKKKLKRKKKKVLSGDQSFPLQYLKLISVKLVYCRNLEYQIRKTNEIK